MPEDLTTLICLYHSKEHAQAALEKIAALGVPERSIEMVGGDGSNVAATDETLTALDVPARDRQHLLDGIAAGGVVLSVAALSEHVAAVEDVFHRYAEKIDEVDLARPVITTPVVPPAASSDAVIPIVEEEMSVGKRTVDAGGVRVFRRIVEIPVNESVQLREEHVSVDRHAVDRAVTDADLLGQGDRVIELTETAEEAVVGKSARVVEEVYVGKEGADRVEHIRDTVRRTEVEVETIEPETEASRSGGI